MADSLTTLLRPSDGSIRCQIGNTFLILQAGTFKIGKSLLVGTENSTAHATILIYADTIEITAQDVEAPSCNVGLFCRSLSLGPFPFTNLSTAGRAGEPIATPNTVPTDINNGRNGGDINVYIEDHDSAKLIAQGNGQDVQPSLYLTSSGGQGGYCAVDGSSVNRIGGNAGRIQFSYLSAESKLLGELRKTYEDTSTHFRLRAQRLVSMVPEGPSSAVGKEAVAVETAFKSLYTLTLNLDNVKRIFHKHMPPATNEAIDSAIKASNDTLRLKTEPRFDIGAFSTVRDVLNQQAISVSRKPLEDAVKVPCKIPWDELTEVLAVFSEKLNEITTENAQTNAYPSSPLALAVEALVSSMESDISDRNALIETAVSDGGGYAGLGGKDGNSTEAVIRALSSDRPALKSAFAYVHPDQCQMLLNAANRVYLKASCDTSNKSPDRFVEAQKLYSAIFRRLSFVPLLQKDIHSKDFQPLTKAYLQMQVDGIALDPVSDLAQIRAQAGLYLCNIAHGKDIFGHDGGGKDPGARWVPRLQYMQYAKAITKSLPPLKKLVISIAAQQGTQQDPQSNVRLLADSVQAHIETLQQQIQLTTSSTGPLNSAGSQIQQYTPALKAMRAIIQVQVAALTDEVQTSWNFNPSDIINGITQLTSSLDELVAGLSIFSGLYTSFTTIEGDDGSDVNKQYVIKQFDSAGKDLGKLNETVKMTASGTYSVDDPGATKLIADEKTLKDLLDKFEGALDAGKVKDLKKTLYEYAKLAKTRNAAVLKYNTAAIMVAKLQDLKLYTKKAAVISRPLLLFQLKIFNSMCATAYELIYETARSTQLWTLWLDDQVDPPLPTSGFDDDNTVEQIKNYVDSLDSKFTSWLSLYSENPGLIFPNPTSAPGQTSSGITWFLSQDQVSDLQNKTIDDLSGSTGQQEYQIMFTLPAPTSQSTGTSGSPDYNLFTGYANVRVNQVLVWLFGARVQPDKETQQCRLCIEISHLGNDTITKNDGKTNLQFLHSATQLKFVYDPTNVTSWAAAQKTNPITVQNLDSGGEGAGRDSARTERSLSVAPIGPFATWMLTVRERENNGLDLSKLTGICLEFWGSAHTVDAS
ncbi:serine protein kinase [Fusarium austroafricanum]|uniref:Serine protein kinase n=1 Tax=Fusarium austroafricanum TaxID=2364996 RepID=A0A8H4NGT1_9HYPO|nr:serine protein kinase [Fusarium austroafricanum]